MRITKDALHVVERPILGTIDAFSLPSKLRELGLSPSEMDAGYWLTVSDDTPVARMKAVLSGTQSQGWGPAHWQLESHVVSLRAMHSDRDRGARLVVVIREKAFELWIEPADLEAAKAAELDEYPRSPPPTKLAVVPVNDASSRLLVELRRACSGGPFGSTLVYVADDQSLSSVMLALRMLDERGVVSRGPFQLSTDDPGPSDVPPLSTLCTKTVVTGGKSVTTKRDCSMSVRLGIPRVIGNGTIDLDGLRRAMRRALPGIHRCGRLVVDPFVSTVRESPITLLVHFELTKGSGSGRVKASIPGPASRPLPSVWGNLATDPKSTLPSCLVEELQGFEPPPFDSPTLRITYPITYF